MADFFARLYAEAEDGIVVERFDDGSDVVVGAAVGAVFPISRERR